MVLTLTRSLRFCLELRLPNLRVVCCRQHLQREPRGRFSASQATGLIGLKENRFLADFFECLGFLSLGSERCGAERSTVLV